MEKSSETTRRVAKRNDGASAARAASVLRGAAVARCLVMLVGFTALESVEDVIQQQQAFFRQSVVPLLQKLSALYGNLTFITVFTKGLDRPLSLKMLIWYLISNYGFKIHPNISLPSPDRYSRSPDQNPVCMSQPSHAYCMPRPYGPPSRCSYGLRSYGTLRGVRR